MEIRNNLVGKKFGKLMVLSLLEERKKSKVVYKCICDCGNSCETQSDNLVSGNSKSCGCVKKIRLADLTRKHGMRSAPEYYIFMAIRQRCNYSKSDNYERYGGRGIKCLYNSFQEFIDDVGCRPSSKHQINRINNDGNYEQGNVNWVTPSENAFNRRPKRK